MRSFATAALCLALLHTSDARVPHSFRDLIQRDAQPQSQPQEGVFDWLVRLFKRELKPRQGDSTCYEDDYYTFVGSPSLGEGFCQHYMDYPNRTVPVEETATSTLTTTYTTDVDTTTEYTIETPGTTLTATVTAGAAKVKRDVDTMITARAVLNRNEAFQLFRRQANVTANDETMSSSFSSACDCHDYQGPVVSSTYTGVTTVQTLKAVANEDATVTETQTVDPSIVETTTTTVAAAPPATTPAVSPSEGPSPTEGEMSPSNPTPTAPPFVCPEDHNTTRSQMVGSSKFAYLVLCDTVLMDTDFYNGTFSYATFEECVGACSITDQRFDSPVCQGVSYSSSEGSCFLKGAANHTVAAPGVDSALLLNVALGMENDTVGGTTTESLPFAGQPTTDPAQVSSIMASMFANSTATMPMATPLKPAVQSGRQAAAITAYSTYVSDGSTYSTGTGYSFSTSFANGSWYFAYYTSYTKTWESATTVYGATETGLAVQNSTNTNSYQTNGENGDYGIVTWSNTTNANGGRHHVVQTISYDANGTPFFSTATTYETAATGDAGGGAGGSGSGAPASGPLVTPTSTSNNGSSSGGDSGAGNGGPGSGGPSSPITLTSTSLTQTVIYNSGGTGAASGGGGAGGAGSGGPPMTYTGVSTLVTNGSTAYETYFIISGGPAGTGSVGSGQGSGGPTSAPTLTPITVISTTGATGGESGNQGAGGPGNTGGASSLIGSGGPSPSPPSSPSVSFSIVTVITNSGATNGGSSGFGAGGPGQTGAANNLVGSGGPSTSSRPTASFPNDNRSGTYSTTTTTTVNVTAAVGTSPTASFPSDFRSGTYSTSTPTASFPEDNRSGTYSLSESTAPGTAPESAPTTSGTAPPGTSSPTASFPGDDRSGTISESASSMSMPILTAPSGVLATPPGSVPGTAPGSAPTTNGTAPPGTSSPTASFPQDNRSGTTSDSTSSIPILTAPSGVYASPPGTAPGTAPGSAPTTNGTAPAGTSSPSASFPQDNRSGTISTSPSSAPLLTAPSGGVYAPPPGTAPLGTAPPGTAPLGTAPAGTSPLTASFPGDNRSGTYDSSSPPGTAPTAPSGYLPYVTGPLPSGPSPFPVPSGSAPPGTAPAPSGSAPSGTAPRPSGSAPSGTAPLPSGYASPSHTSEETPVPNGHRGHGPLQPASSPASGTGFSTGFGLSGYPAPTGTAPGTAQGTAPTGTSPTASRPFDNRSGTISGTMPLSTHPHASMTFPTAQSSCANMTMGTTTMFSTTTVYGCYSTCLPSWGGWGGYGGPHPFGPPAQTERPDIEQRS